MQQVPLAGGSSLRTPATYEDYLALGEAKHHEYFDGMCIVNPPSRRHILATKLLTRLLDDHCPVGFVVYPEWGWRIADGVEVQPDVMVAAADAPGEDQLRVPPLLVVEVESPSTRDLDRSRKRQLYAEGGAAWYWLVDPDAPSLTVLRREGSRFVEAQRVEDEAVTVGPFAVPIRVHHLPR